MMLHSPVIFIAGILAWSFATGLREGYTFMVRRLRIPRLPLMRYHWWRYVEQLGIVAMIYGSCGLRITVLYIGLNWLLVYTVYEPALDWMIEGELVFFKEENPYEGVNMGRPVQIAVTLAGMALIIIAIKWSDLWTYLSF